ncbi:hypothetical protein WV31_13050 [Magnetospirillum sp. ME-1]|uniref:methyltransferase domain-containing protein n=1 Tax=Magnetospirillum sp. ME-1 TaxID=1639348 RepID=UPI000A17D4DF|nr:methyltransferase domain-containing protein [Magnetospirillum sp. ME-1]ARJ66529.1 hypothetical protein WV31_13050 [Magnetospirillum sp. ME-1]
MSAFGLAKGALRAVGLEPRAAYQRLSAASIRAALAEQGLDALAGRLREAVPDIADQYTGTFDTREFQAFWDLKMRGQHAFQVQATLDMLDLMGPGGLTVVDIGDSSGTHARYLRAVTPPGRLERIVGVNLDPEAVERIRAKGGEAVLSRAEELDPATLKADLFLSFETLEHLTDPLRFLHGLAAKGSADWLLATVPYRRRSRFGGAQLRWPDHRMPAKMTPEQVHIYEFSPADWSLAARLAGWRPVMTRIYRQYPLRSPLAATMPLWQRLDFEGFVALGLRRDLTLADRYSGW